MFYKNHLLSKTKRIYILKGVYYFHIFCISLIFYSVEDIWIFSVQPAIVSLHGILGGDWEWKRQMKFRYYHENSFDFLDPLKVSQELPRFSRPHDENSYLTVCVDNPNPNFKTDKVCLQLIFNSYPLLWHFKYPVCRVLMLSSVCPETFIPLWH